MKLSSGFFEYLKICKEFISNWNWELNSVPQMHLNVPTDASGAQGFIKS